MTSVSRYAHVAVFAGLLFHISSYSETAQAYAPLTQTSPTASASVLTVKTKSAELCTSNDGRIQVARSFDPSETYFVEAPRAPGAKPEINEGYTFSREASGFTQKNEVSFDMFELMVEPFGGAPMLRTEWLKTYEEIFEGKITVLDTAGKKVGTYVVSCNAAVVEFM